MGKLESGLHECAYLSIMKCDESIRGDIFSNIILAGGSSMFPGMTDRIGKEFSLLAPQDITVNIISPSERQNSVWLGGATVAALPAFKPCFITKDEYAEHGASIVHKKCLN
jgi:actin-related protein